MSISVGEIPQIDGDLDAVDGAGSSLKSAGSGFADTGSDVHTTWQGLSGVYKAPESGDLLAATAPVSADAATVGGDVGSVGSALSAYASEVRPIKAELERLKLEAVSFNSSIEGDDDWDSDEDKVNEKNKLLKSVNAAVAAWQAAERTCASAINATFGGVQYHADDGQGAPSADEYGYSAELLDGATAGDDGVPWGKASEVDKPWYKDLADGVVSFGKGLVVDGLWGAVRGIGTMVGVDGAAAAGQAWAGIGKLALSLSPVAMVIDQTVGMPGMEKGELGQTQLAAGKALIAYDMWGKDPARASGAVVGNVLGAVIGTKGAGAAVKAGTVAKVGGTAARVFPRTAELAANIGGKVGDLKLNIASSLNTKMASLGEKIAIPKFGPEPAMAGAGGRGGSVFEMTPGTRGGPSGAGVAARIDDAAPGGGATRAGEGAGPAPSQAGGRPALPLPDNPGHRGSGTASPGGPTVPETSADGSGPQLHDQPGGGVDSLGGETGPVPGDSPGSANQPPPSVGSGSATGGESGPRHWTPVDGPGPLGEDVAKTFRSATYDQYNLTEQADLYRVHSPEGQPLGRYWTRTEPAGPMQAQLDLALNPDWGNTAEAVTKVRVPPGTEVFEGVAGPQELAHGGRLMGGGNQVYINQVLPEWVRPAEGPGR